MNLNRNNKNTSYKTQNHKEWLRVNSEEWKSVTPRSNLTLVDKRQEPLIISGIRTKKQTRTFFGFLKAIVEYPTDLAAKFIGWLTTWN